VLIYVGSAIIFVWGLAHLIATRSVVSGFGEPSDDNRRIITMEWIGSGLTLCFIGIIVMLASVVACSMNPILPILYRGSAILLLVLAAVGMRTGAKTSSLPMKLCPVVKTVVAILFILGSLL
jgi:hypothetical protein